MANPRQRHEAYPHRASNLITKTYSGTLQSHALRLPVRQSPRQRQWELLPLHVFVSLRRRFHAVHGHPPTPINDARAPVWILYHHIFEEAPSINHTLRPVFSLRNLVKLNVVELNDHTDWRTLSRVARRGIPARGPDKAFYCAHGTVNKPSFNPEVPREQNTSAFAELEFSGQSEIIIIHQIRSQLTLALPLLMMTAEARHGHPLPRG